MSVLRTLLIWMALGTLVLNVEAGFVQLTDREQAASLDGSTADGAGYVSLAGSSSQFSGHALGSQSFTITLWIQETANSPGTTATILHLQQAGVSISSSAPGTMVPALFNTQTSVTACIDTSATTNQCKTLSKTNDTLYTWAHYFISVCKSSAEMRVCYTSWRGTSTCDTESLTGDILTFEPDSTAYLGGSPYDQGIVGKLVDVRFYDASCYTTSEAQLLAVNRRCASTCWYSWWGPDDKSCNGLQFLDPFYATVLDSTDTINQGKIEFPGNDIKFKGHQLGSQEMSVCAWINSDLDASRTNHLWRFSITNNESGVIGDKILAAEVKPNLLNIYSSTDANADLLCSVTTTFTIDRAWAHISASISQSNNQMIWCVALFSNQQQECATTSLTGNVTTLTTSGKLILGKFTGGSGNSLEGRVVDFKFFPTLALTAKNFKEIVGKAALSCAPSCNGNCFGPDTWSCSDYVELIDPRISKSFTQADTSEWLYLTQNDPIWLDYTTYGPEDWSLSTWIYTQDALLTEMQVIFFDYDFNLDCDFMELMIQLLNPTEIKVYNTDCARNQHQQTVQISSPGWVHLTIGLDNSTQTLCITEFNLSNPSTTCTAIAITEPLPFNPSNGNIAQIFIAYPLIQPFQGKLVDTRYYPNKTLYQADAEALIAAFSCVNDTTDCTGPDVSSVSYLPLSEPNFEYLTYSSGGEGLEYFKLSAEHYNFLKSGVTNSKDYAFSVWVIGEERLDDAELVRFYDDPNDGCDSTLARKIPSVEVGPSNTEAYNDAAGNACQSLTHTISPANHRYQTSFNTYVSTCNSGDFTNCYTEWGDTADCSQATLTGTSYELMSSSYAYLGGTPHKTSQQIRVTNLRYYPTTCPTQAQISPSLNTQTCDVQCGGQCYGPGINSCIYDEPLFLSDEWEPFVGDGSTSVTKRGTDIEFDGRFMSYPNYSLSLWFKLNTNITNDELVLAVMTKTSGNIGSQWRLQAPKLYVRIGKIYAAMATDDDVVYTTAGIDVNIATWYLACVVVSQKDSNMSLYVAQFQGSKSTESVSFAGVNAGYFDSNGFFYYGGVQNNGQFLNGYMLDLRFWDTKSLSFSEFNSILQSKGCYPTCSTCTDLESDACTSCESPYLLSENSCVKTCPSGKVSDGQECVCPSGQYSDGTECKDCDQNCAVSTCSGPNECTECNKPYFRLDGQCYSSCGEGGQFEDTTTSPDYQCLTCHEDCETCTGSGEDACTSCKTGLYLQAGASICLNTCPPGYVSDDITRSCVQCPDYCTECISLSECTTCEIAYVMRSDHLCYTTCPDAEFADESHVCVAWYATCATCDSGDENICIECIQGLERFDADALAGPCDCSDVSGLSKEAKLACAPVRAASSTSTEELLNEVADLMINEILTEAELTSVLTTMDAVDASDDSQQSQLLDIIQTGGMRTLINSNGGETTAELKVVTEKFDASFELNSLANFEGASVETSTGSGVALPIDLMEFTTLPNDANLVVSVIQFKANQTDFDDPKPDTVKIDVNHIKTDGSADKMIYQNLTSNFTIIFEGQNFDQESNYTCAWFNETIWTSSGCSIGDITNTTASCLCNHLTEFSVRNSEETAVVDNNAAATVNFTAVKGYDITKNPYPVIICGSILLLFIVLYIFSNRLDKRDRKVASAQIIQSTEPVTIYTSKPELTTTRNTTTYRQWDSQISGLMPISPDESVDISQDRNITSVPDERPSFDIDKEDWGTFRGALTERFGTPEQLMRQNLQIHTLYGAFEEDEEEEKSNHQITITNVRSRDFTRTNDRLIPGDTYVTPFKVNEDVPVVPVKPKMPQKPKLSVMPTLPSRPTLPARPKQSTAVTRPSQSTAVTRPTQSTAVTRPTQSTARTSSTVSPAVVPGGVICNPAESELWEAQIRQLFDRISDGRSDDDTSSFPDASQSIDIDSDKVVSDFLTGREEPPKLHIDRTIPSFREIDSSKQDDESKKGVKDEFFQAHPFFRIWIKGNPKTLRTERLINYLCVIMITIFATGMFYNTDEEDSNTDDMSIKEIAQDIGWDDILIAFYSSAITIPVPILLEFLYSRSDIDITKTKKLSQRCLLWKRIFAHILAGLTVSWCCWSVLAFSLEFGHANTVKWMIAFAGSEIFDLGLKDHVITLVFVLILMKISKKDDKEKSFHRASTLRKLGKILRRFKR